MQPATNIQEIFGSIEKAKQKVVYIQANKDSEIAKLREMGFVNNPVEEAEDAIDKKEIELKKVGDECAQLKDFIINKFNEIIENIPEEIRAEI